MRSISSEPKALSKRIRILLVDDEVSFLEMSRVFLRRINPFFIINTSTSAINALTALKSVDYDIIISDYAVLEEWAVLGESGLARQGQKIQAGEIAVGASVANGTFVEGHEKYGRNKPKDIT